MESLISNMERLERMRRAMVSAGLDALVLRLPENVLLLSGFWPMIGATTLVFPVDGRPHCVVPHCYEMEAAASLWDAAVSYYRFGVLDSPEPASAIGAVLAGLHGQQHWRRIGYEGDFEVVSPSWNSAEALVPAARTRRLYSEAFPGSELVDASALLKSERRTKTSYEIGKLKRAGEISCFGLEAFERAVQLGASGVELAAEVERDVMVRGTGYQGAERVRAYAQVAVGPDESAVGYRPNEISTTHRLQDGEVALLELGVVVDGYWADRTRVKVAGGPREEQVRIFETVKQAQQAAVAALRPGVRAADVDEAARSVIRNAGYEASFPHITGHGLGFGYHESSPILAPGSTDVLEENMLTSVEPGIYCKGIGGFRIEDDVFVTKQGPMILGPFQIILS
jgi:Xaa-Pro dipeptidase